MSVTLDSRFRKEVDNFYWNVIRNDIDMLVVVVGKERAGKTTLSKHTGNYINAIRSEYWGLPESYIPKKSISLSPYRFAKSVQDAGTDEGVPTPGGVLIYDEAVTGTGARRSASTPNVAINTILMQCGMKNLAMFMNIPSFFGLDQNCRVRRVAMVCHVKMDTETIEEENGRQFEKLTRGYFDLYMGSHIHEIGRNPDGGAEIWPKPTYANMRFAIPEVNFKSEEGKEEDSKSQNIAREVQRIKEWEDKTYGQPKDDPSQVHLKYEKEE